MSQTAAKLMEYLLCLPHDAPQLAHLASMALLVTSASHNHCLDIGWATAEMEMQRQDIKNLEAAWNAFSQSKEPQDADPVLTSAALSLVYKQMVAAVRNRRLIPAREELLTRVAEALFGMTFQSVADVELAVRMLQANAPKMACEAPVAPSHVRACSFAVDTLLPRAIC